MHVTRAPDAEQQRGPVATAPRGPEAELARGRVEQTPFTTIGWVAVAIGALAAVALAVAVVAYLLA